MPGIPRHRGYKVAPNTLTWYDLCRRERIYLKSWPEGTTDDCRMTPSLCPQVKAPTKNFSHEE